MAQTSSQGNSFSAKLGDTLECGLYITTTKDLSFISYLNLASLMSSGDSDNFATFPCEIITERNI
jgi:hypothetical protein